MTTPITQVQIAVSDRVARYMAAEQPASLPRASACTPAAPASRSRSAATTPGTRLHGAMHIPDGMSLLLRLHPQGVRSPAWTWSRLAPGQRRAPVFRHDGLLRPAGLGRLLALAWWRRRDCHAWR